MQRLADTELIKTLLLSVYLCNVKCVLSSVKYCRVKRTEYFSDSLSKTVVDHLPFTRGRLLYINIQIHISIHTEVVFFSTD